MECSIEEKLQTHTFKTEGTCSKAIDVTLSGEIIEDVCFYGGAPGIYWPSPPLLRAPSG